MAVQSANYPMSLEVDPPASQSRLSVFFRIFYLIPQIVVLYLVQIVASLFVILAWFAVLFTGSYPSALAGFVAGWVRWSVRVQGYGWLLTGAYPPFSLNEEPGYAIRPTVDVQLESRSRLSVFFRPLLAIPLIIVFYVYALIGTVVLFIAWLAALFTGSVPAGLHNYLAGLTRYYVRFVGYAYFLTDRYPPFGLS